ncbi:GNAT family N-acetyltransferase [Candidatus Saccharibacteria bacterium]|nr:GNAT family N-acetyltransferase [Candidatus Saccharibacteria bacterium]
MPLPLEIATTPHAHDAQVGEIIDLLCKPSICGPISDILGRDAFMEAATDLTQRLYLGECAAALARYIDESSNTIKPVGTIIYSQDSNDPKITNLELIVVREKYRRRKVGTRLLQLVETETALRGATQLQTLAPQKMPGLQNLLAKNGFYFSCMKEGGGLFLRYRKRLKVPRILQKNKKPRIIKLQSLK